MSVMWVRLRYQVACWGLVLIAACGGQEQQRPRSSEAVGATDPAFEPIVMVQGVSVLSRGLFVVRCHPGRLPEGKG